MKKCAQAGCVLAVLLMAVAGSGCVSYEGLKPVSPEYGATVSNLQPTLRWEPDSAEGATYDVTINTWAAPTAKDSPEAGGATVYYREGLPHNLHKVDTPLQPNRQYTWSVRPRRDGQPGIWTRRRVSIVTVLYDRTRLEPLTLRTPASDADKAPAEAKE